MSEEIENILGNINFEVETEQEWLEPLGLDRNTWKQILNYITNLQEENKQLKEDKKKARDFIEEWCTINPTTGKCVCYLDKNRCTELYKILGDKENE